MVRGRHKSPTDFEHESKFINFFFFLLAHFFCWFCVRSRWKVAATAPSIKSTRFLLLLNRERAVRSTSWSAVETSRCSYCFTVLPSGSMHCLYMCRQFVMMKTSAAWRVRQSTATWRPSTSTTLERRRHQFWRSLLEATTRLQIICGSCENLILLYSVVILKTEGIYTSFYIHAFIDRICFWVNNTIPLLQELRRLGGSKHILPWQCRSSEDWWTENSRPFRNIQTRRLQYELVVYTCTLIHTHMHVHTHTHPLHTARYEQPPYNQGTMRSAYHVRSCDVFRLKQVNYWYDIRVMQCCVSDVIVMS